MNYYYLIPIILAIIFFSIIVFFIKKDIFRLYLNLKERIIKNDKEFEKVINKILKIILLGIFLNKLLVLVPYLNEILNYLIIDHQLIKMSILDVINAVLTFILITSFFELVVKFIYASYDKEKIEEANLDDLIKYLGAIIAFTISLAVLGINMGLLIPLAGALGLGVGFALQDLLKNLIAGLVILFGKVVKKGDYIKINDLEGYVREINLRTTLIETLNNEEIIIPNSFLTQNPLINYSLSEPLIRIRVPFGVSYKSDLKKVFEIAKEIADKYSEKEADVLLQEFGDSSVNFVILLWINIKKIAPLKASSLVYNELFKRFKEEGIEIPFSQLDVWFKNELKIKEIK